MNAATPPSPAPTRLTHLQVSNYERAASLMLALIVLLGVMVLTLLILWWTFKISLGQTAVPSPRLELGSGDNALGGGMELDGPTEEEIGLETDWDEPALEETLLSITAAVGTMAPELDDPALTDEARSGRGGGSRGDGRGVGDGSGDGGSGIARHWEVRFRKSTLNAYAQQLDGFDIELGVLLPGNKVKYAKNLAKSKPDTRVGKADEEQRYYLTWRSGDLEQADRELLRKAGIQSKGRLVLKFLEREQERALEGPEKGFKDRDPGQVRKTVFGIRESGSAYEFFVIYQLGK